MRYFRVLIKGPRVNLYPLVCWHLGAKQSSRPFIDMIIKEIQNDPLAKWIYMGDFGDCVVKNSKGNIYEQLASPGDQLREAVDITESIRDKGLFGIRGNHGNRVDKEVGVGWDEMLCARMGIPYLGVAALVEFVLNPKGSCVKLFTVYVHHGSAGAVSPGGKMAAAVRPFDYVLSDVVLTSHTHAAIRTIPRVFAYAAEGKIKYRQNRGWACGSGYDSRSGYAEEKMYSPMLPAHIRLRVEAKRFQRNGHDSYILDIKDDILELNDIN